MKPRKPLKRSKKKFGPSLRYELILDGAVRKYKGSGREVCQDNAAGKREYEFRTMCMNDRQSALCCICGKWMGLFEVTFEHEDLRGMGGARRDDRIEIDGKPVNGAAHYSCNGERGSKRTVSRF